MVNVQILPVDQALRLRRAAHAIRAIAAADEGMCDYWAMALAAWESILGEPVHDDVLGLALELPPAARAADGGGDA